MLAVLAWYAVSMASLSATLLVIAAFQWTVASVGRLRHQTTATAQAATSEQVAEWRAAPAEVVQA